MKPYRIIIADDHSLIRQGIKSILLQDSSLQIAGEAANGFDLLNLMHKDPPDMVILDITMPHLNGIETMERIRKSCPEVAILILTMHSGSQYFYNAIAAGAHGFLIKDDSDAELLTAIQTVREGKPYVSPQLCLEVGNEAMVALSDRCRVPLVVMTEREKQVLGLVVQGHSSKKIAKMLDLSPRTVDHHRANLIRKFKMKNTVDLVNHVVRNGVITIDV